MSRKRVGNCLRREFTLSEKVTKMSGFDEIFKKIAKKSKTVEEIRCIYSEVSEEGHKWVHLEDVKDIIKEWWSGRIEAFSYEDGEEIQVNITDSDSSVLLTFGSEEDYRKFCEEVAKLQRH